MSKELIGNSYTYMVDENYGINKDGFIAIGSESIVFKGLKVSSNGDMHYSCVLKFKPKTQIIGGKAVDRLAQFKAEEWKIFQELRECRSVVRIDDVIEDLGDFSLPCHCEGHFEGVIDASLFFCVVEEYIDGWNLDEFCREEFWKLRKVEPLANGLNKRVEFHDFSEEEQKSVLATYHYDNQLKFQNQILLLMINLCEIMEFVTERKNILHLDIKPENIMVTRYGKELVLIDFGRSHHITMADRFVNSPLAPVNYNEDESQELPYQYGTLGYAAPECYCEPAAGSAFPFSYTENRGKMSIESDIFSFGATFWECLNMFELVTRSRQNMDFYDFYKHHFLNDEAYFSRDLSLTSTAYHQQLERIIKKCTKARRPGFTESDKYYHSYRDLKQDLERAKDSTPTIVKEENVKVRIAFKLSSVLFSLAMVLLIINGIYHTQDLKIAENRWNSLTAGYNETQFARLAQAAEDYISASPAGAVSGTYRRIFDFVKNTNGRISDYEAAMLVALLEEMDDSASLGAHVDEIMMHADPSSFKNISTEIIKLDAPGNSIGYELAVAIYNVEVSKTNIPEAFRTLEKYRFSADFANAVVKLKYVLDKDAYITMIMNDTGMTRQEVIDFFSGI